MPSALRVLLLAIAIIDDIGAIVVIAIFYSRQIDPTGLALAAIGTGALVFLARRRPKRAVRIAIVGASIVVWLGLLVAHVHPAIAGVVVGLVLGHSREELL